MTVTSAIALAGQELLTQYDPNPQPGQNSTGAEFGKAAPIGFVIVLLILVALILLIRSMNRHVRALPSSFDHADGDGPPDTKA